MSASATSDDLARFGAALRGGLSIAQHQLLAAWEPYVNEPRWFKARMVRGGFAMPCRTWVEIDRDEDGEIINPVRYYAEFAGEPCDIKTPPYLPWEPIEEREFRYLTDLMAWAKQHQPSHPINNPTKAARLAPQDERF